MAREDRSMPYGVVHSTVGEVLGRHAVSRGEKTFLSFEGRDFTYAFADRHSNRVANGLRDKVKVGKGDHVGLLLGNCPEFLWSVFGLGDRKSTRLTSSH